MQIDKKSGCCEPLEPEHTRTSGLVLEAAVDTEVFAPVVVYQVENAAEWEEASVIQNWGPIATAISVLVEVFPVESVEEQVGLYASRAVVSIARADFVALPVPEYTAAGNSDIEA